jgi:hypothetical protein
MVLFLVGNHLCQGFIKTSRTKIIRKLEMWIFEAKARGTRAGRGILFPVPQGEALAFAHKNGAPSLPRGSACGSAWESQEK